MTIPEAIEVLAQDLPCETDEDLSEAMTQAIKALETIQRIDDVLNVEGMTEIDVLDEIMEAVSEFKYDCGVDE